MDARYVIRPLLEVPTGAVADALAAAFGADRSTPSEWRSMLARELETGRADARASAVVLAPSTRPTSAPRVAGACLVHFGDEPFGHIGATGVRKNDRGHGIGRAMVTWALDALDRACRSDVVLEVEHGNDTARALYESLGFRRVRALHTLVLTRAHFTVRLSGWPARPISRIAAVEAIAAASSLETHRPAFQRRADHLATFSDETAAFGVRVAGRIEALFIQKGASLFDLKAPADLPTLHSMLSAALERAPELRLIHVSEDDPLLLPLLSLGAVITTTVDELRLEQS